MPSQHRSAHPPAPNSERFWSIHFGPLKIGLLDEYKRTTLRIPVQVSPMSPD